MRDRVKNRQTKMNNVTKVSMGKGSFYLMIANGVFFVAGYIIHFGLGRYLGPVDYGIFGVILSLMTIVNTFLTSGFPQSASRYIAEEHANIGSIVRATNRIQLALCIVFFALYFGMAGIIANLLNDPSLTPYIRISALVVPAYALYGIYSAGYLNGLRYFFRQAISRVGDSIAKVIMVFALVLLGFGVKGAITGYNLAAFVGFLLAWRFLGPMEKSSRSFDWRKLAGFGTLATLFAVMLYILMSIDLLAVKAFVKGEAEVGYYTSASAISRAPYAVFTGLGLALLPSISRSISIKNAELTKNLISQSTRYMLILLIPGTLLISATSADLLTLVYSSRFVEAARPLSILVLGIGFLCVFSIMANIIMGSGRPRVTLFMSLPLVVVDVLLNILLVPSYGLIGAALATTITGFLGMCAAVTYVFWRFRTFIHIKSLVRICLSSLVIYYIAWQVSSSPLWLPAIYVGLFTLYVGILWLTKELGREDLAIFRRITSLDRLFNNNNPDA